MNAKLGQIMRIMESNIWLLETLFILSIQTFEGQYLKVNSISYVLTVFGYAKGRLKNRFFPKKCPLGVFLRAPPKKRQYLKSLKSIFFPNIRFDMLSVVQGLQRRTGSLRISLF